MVDHLKKACPYSKSGTQEAPRRVTQKSTSVAYLTVPSTTDNGSKQTCGVFCPDRVNGGGWVSVLRADRNGTTVMLIWEPNTGAGGTQYVIQFREANIADTASFNTSAPIVNDTNFTLTGLAPVTLYDVRVCLIELPEECGGCILCVMAEYDPVPPPRPSLTGSPINALSVRLMWERPLGDVDRYIIQYSVVNSSELLNISFLAPASDWTVRRLSPNTTYQFRLVAVSNEYGRSLPSLPFFATTPIQSGSPGYLLISTYDDGTFYALTNSDALGSPAVTPRLLEIESSGISGIGYYPINSTNGFIYTTHDRAITRHSATLSGPTLSISASDNVMNRSSSVSLISVDWVNDMLYWLETVSDTYSLIMYSLLDGSDMNCVRNISIAGGLRVTGIEVDPIHGYLYWSVLGSGGGIFRLDLTLAKSGRCNSSVTDVYRIVDDFNATGITAMTLNLEDSLLYFAFGTTNLSAITLGENSTEHFPHVGTRVDIRSIASYNEYLVVTSPSTDDLVLGSFVRIRSSPPGTVRRDVVGIRGFNLGENVTHFYMIREEFQPLPVPPGPVNEVKYFPTVTSINITWSPPQYTNSAFGPSAFSEWMYNLTFQSNSDATVDTEYLYSDLPPNAVYAIDILPSVPGVVGNVDNNTLTSSWIVQTAENVMPIPNIILATNANGSVPIYTVMFNGRQAMQLLEEGEPVFDQPSIGVAYDFYRNTIYWTNSNRDIVKSSLSNGETVAIGEAGDGRTSIAVDYIGQRLYWIESNSIYRMLLESNNALELIRDVDISDLAVDSPSGLLFWTHNEGALRGISAMRLNGLGDRMICVSDSSQLYRYLAITVDTENKRIFWIKEVEGSFQIGVADYGSGSCINVVNKVISDKASIQRRVSVVSMVYVAGVLLHTLSTSPNTIFITPSNFSSFPSADYQLAIGSYNISVAPDINIRSITANQTSQQFLPDNVGLNVTTVRPAVPSNIRLDNDSSNYTFINITWDMVEGVSPAIVTYEVTYSLSRIDESIENGTILKTSDNYFVLEDQLPETTVNVSIRAFTRWYTSDTSPVQTIVSESKNKTCLFPALTQAFQPVPMCYNASSDSLTVTWTEPRFTTACEDQLYTTLSYNITYHVVGFPNEDEEINNIFSRQTTVDGLFSFSNYDVTVSASNIYTPSGSDATAVLNSVTCRTAEGVPSQVRNLTASANSTTQIYVTWERPIASGTIENSLSYNISINGNFLELLGNTTTMHLIANLTPSTDYIIQVISNNSLGVSDPVQVDGFTFPRPPVPIILGFSSETVQIQLTLLFNHRFLNISVELIDLMTGEANQSVMLSNDTMYPSVLPLTLNSLLSATNYDIRTSAVYPGGQIMLSNASSFRINNGAPETPEITLDGFMLLWDKPRENGQPITEFTLRVESRDQYPGILVLNDMTNNIDLSMKEFAYDLSTIRIITPGIPTDISLRASNSIGDSDYSNSVTVTIPEPSDAKGLTTGVLTGIIIGASVFALLLNY